MVITPTITVFATEPEAMSDTVNVDKDSEETTVVVESITVDNGKSAIVADGSGTTEENPVSVTVEGDVTSSGNIGSSYTDSLGDKYYKSDTAVIAKNGAEVTVNGNINAKGDEQHGIMATDGAQVTVDGKVDSKHNAVIADNAKVTIDGDINGAQYGIKAENDSTVTVDGDVQSSGFHTVSVGPWDPVKQDYSVKEHGTTGNAVYTDGTSDIYVFGNAIGTKRGISIEDHYGLSRDAINGNIVVDGTVDSASGPSILVSYSWNSQVDGFDSSGYPQYPVYNSLDDVLASLPEITVYQLGSHIRVNRNVTDSSVTSQQVQDAVNESINYIIKQNQDDVDKYEMQLSDENIKVVTAKDAEGNTHTYNTVNIGNAFKVAAKLPDGYTLSGGDYVKVDDNGDGTYTLRLYATNGGINIKAVLRPVPSSSSSEENSSSSSGQQYEVVVQEVTPAYADPNQAPAGAIVVANTPAASAPSEVAAISGDKPARTVSYSIANITPIQYKASIIENVTAAPAGGALNIETDRVACFDKKMIEAFASRKDVDVNVVFTYGGKKLKVTIPAGYDVHSLLDASGYCGFLRLLSILGGTEL